MRRRRVIGWLLILIVFFLSKQFIFRGVVSREASGGVNLFQIQNSIRITEEISPDETHYVQPNSLTKSGQQLSVDNKDSTSANLQPNYKESPGTPGNNPEFFQNVQAKFELIQPLVQSLRSKLALADNKNVLEGIHDKCKAMGIEYNDTCNGTDRICPQKVLPEDLQTRIEQLVLRENLQIPVQYREVIKNMSQEIKGYHDLIVVSGLSSNHYLEAQALFKQLHEEVFPVLKNFTFVVYNLGLTEAEASQVRKHCRCQFVTFPYESFPPHFKTLKCFGFKPAIVRAMAEKAEVVLWTDTSFRTSSEITTAIDQARKLGVQQRYYEGQNPNPSHTLEEMFHYFGDSPCAHMAFNQVSGGFGIYHSELFVKRAILDPWYSCAIRSACTCPVEQRKVQACPSAHETRKIGLCHRADQSSLTLILSKLFRDKYRSFVVGMGRFDKRRVGRTHGYFEELENRTLAV